MKNLLGYYCNSLTQKRNGTTTELARLEYKQYYQSLEAWPASQLYEHYL
jgi:hypothetical protein